MVITKQYFFLGPKHVREVNTWKGAQVFYSFFIRKQSLTEKVTRSEMHLLLLSTACKCCANMQEIYVGKCVS